MRITIHASITWTIRRVESGRFVAWCDPLGLTVEADTQPELHSMIEEAHFELFSDLLHENELDAFLRDRNWTHTRANHRSDEDPGVRFDVPYGTIVAPHAAA